MGPKREFTYSKSSKELRKGVITLIIVLLFDIPVHYVLTLLNAPWDRVSGLSLLALELFFIWAVTRVLRTKHFVDDTKLGLRFGLALKTDIPLDHLVSAEPYQGRVPFLSLFPEVQQEEDSDTAFVLATEKLREKMVVLTLREGCELNLVRKKPVVRHVVLSVDQPEEFLASVRPSAATETVRVDRLQLNWWSPR